MKITPSKDLVLVRVVENEDFYSSKTPGGIILPDKRNLNMSVGEILENGRLVMDSPASKKRVVFSKHSGNQIVLDDGHYILLKPSDVLGFID